MQVNQVDSASPQSTEVSRVERTNVSAEKNQTESAAYKVELSKEAQEQRARELEELESQAQEEQLNAEVRDNAAQNAPQSSENEPYNNSGEFI